jgi:hypothetical protein
MKNDWFLWLCSFALISLVLGLGFSKKAHANTNTVSSTVTVDKAPPSAISPSVNAQSDLCVVPVSGAVQSTVIGISAGSVYDSEFCQAIRLSKLLASLGLKVASVSILAQNDARVFDSLFLAGTYPPILNDEGESKIGIEARDEWLKPENAHLIPEGSKLFPKTEVKPIENKQGDWDALKDFGLIALSMLLIL